ncbi:MAG: hypothetical protein RQ826_17925, partial [Xanthomonadales bacterium]|nr:hypothetical protein [Xanthomonadales bacterium]
MPAGPDESNVARIEYPVTRSGDVVDTWHGVEVPDPYRWLETDVRESDEVAAWVEAQNEVTETYLETLESREYFSERLAELWNYERFGLPVKRGEKYFFTRNDGLQNQAVL